MLVCAHPSRLSPGPSKSFSNGVISGGGNGVSCGSGAGAEGGGSGLCGFWPGPALLKVQQLSSQKKPDGVSVHVYASREATGPAVETRISDQYDNEIGGALRAVGMDNAQRWITEFGYGSKPYYENGEPVPADDFDRQRDLLRRMFRYLRSTANPKPVSLLIHRLVDPNPSGSEGTTIERLNFGTMRYAPPGQQPARKRAYCGLALELKVEYTACTRHDQ